MRYEVREQGRFTIIALSGEVDLYYSPEARRQILKCLQDGCHLLVDLSAVEYIDSSGVASLIEGYQLARERNQEFALVGVSDSAMRVLELTRLDKIFPIYACVDECLNRGS